METWSSSPPPAADIFIEQGHAEAGRKGGEGWPEPEKLGEELPPVPHFDADLLPASLRPMVEDVADRMQVPLDFPAIVSISTLAWHLRTPRPHATERT